MTKTQTIISDTEKYICLKDHTGHAKKQIYQIFPGVELAYNQVHMARCPVGIPREGAFVEILHCREGQIAHSIGGKRFSLMPGDLAVAMRSHPPQAHWFPTGRYLGISIGIQLETAPGCFSCFLQDVPLQPLHMANRLCAGQPFLILRKKPYVENIFAGLYEKPGKEEPGYLKIKVLELLYVLNGIAPEREQAASVSPAQAELAKAVSAYLKEGAHRSISVAELARKFHISQKHLLNTFKGVYGVSVSAYIRTLKMQEAARRVAGTSLPVLEIANEYGYDNPSKFAAAFQKVMGKTPLEYRKAQQNHSPFGSL